MQILFFSAELIIEKKIAQTRKVVRHREKNTIDYVRA